MTTLKELDATYRTLVHARHEAEAILRVFQRFAEFAEGTVSEYPALYLAFENSPENLSFRVSTSYQSVMFSLDYEHTESSLLGIVYVHKLPFHEAFQRAQLIDSFTITSTADTSLTRGGGLQRLHNGDQTDTIILHYLTTALDLKPALKETHALPAASPEHLHQ